MKQTPCGYDTQSCCFILLVWLSALADNIPQLSRGINRDSPGFGPTSGMSKVCKLRKALYVGSAKNLKGDLIDSFETLPIHSLIKLKWPFSINQCSLKKHIKKISRNKKTFND